MRSPTETGWFSVARIQSSVWVLPAWSLLSATSPSTRWIRAAFGIASADAVCSCFIHRATPTPARTAHTSATIVRCGHTFICLIQAPLKNYIFKEFGNHHASATDDRDFAIRGPNYYPISL